MKSHALLAVGFIVFFGLASSTTVGQVEVPAATPEELVDAYDSLADTILSSKATELNLVRAILTSTYTHAWATMEGTKAKIQNGANARADIEKLAALVSQLGNEGDAAVAGIRKRLLEGGHHHNALGEQQGIYDEGFVVVTKAAKKALLDAATTIGKQAASPDLPTLESEWIKVKKEFEKLMESAGE